MKSKISGFTRTSKFGVAPIGGGFTLIELLVVVAIISLLSAIVMASLNSARNKGADATIQQQLKNMSSYMELTYGDVGYAGGVCSDTTLIAMINVAKKAAGTTAEEFRCGADINEWVVVERLKSDPLNWWCTDYKGFSGKVLNTTKAFAMAANINTDGNIDCDPP